MNQEMHELLNEYIEKTGSDTRRPLGNEAIQGLIERFYSSVPDAWVSATTIGRWRTTASKNKQIPWQQLASIMNICRVTPVEADALFKAAGYEGGLEGIRKQITKPQEWILLQYWLDASSALMREEIARFEQTQQTAIEKLSSIEYTLKTVEENTEDLDSLRVQRPHTEPPFMIPQPDLNFIGREKEMAELESYLSQNGTRRVAIVGVTGAGGMGKSMLAAHFARKHEKDDLFRDGVILLDVSLYDEHGQMRSDPKMHLLQLARDFAFCGDVDINSISHRSPNEIMQFAFGRKKALLIFDNADHSGIRSLFPSGNTCAVIMTTRQQQLVQPSYEKVKLEGFSFDETKILLYKHLDEERVNESLDVAEKIHIMMGGLPLALRIVIGTLSEQPYKSLVEYYKELLETREKLFNKHLSYKGSDLNVYTSFMQSYNLLEEDEKKLFWSLGACVPQDFGLETAQRVSGLSLPLVQDGMRRLVQLCLVNQGRASDRFQLHPLLAAFAEELADENGWLETAKQHHTNCFVEYIQSRQNFSPEIIDELIKEVDALLLTAKRLKDNLELAKIFYSFLEKFLQSIGYGAQMLEIIDIYVKQAKEQNQHYYHAYFLIQRGQFLRSLNEYDKALEAVREGEEIALHIQEEDDRQELIVMARIKLGGLYRNLDNLKKAEEILRECLAIPQKDRLREAMLLNALAAVLRGSDRLPEAKAVALQALHIHEEFGEEGGRSYVLTTLAHIARAEGNFEEAKERLLEGLKIRRNLGDPLGIIQSLTTLGIVYQSQRSVTEAESALKECAELCQKMGFMREKLYALNILATTYRLVGMHQEAKEVLEEGLNLAISLKKQGVIVEQILLLGKFYWQSGASLDAEGEFQKYLQLIGGEETEQKLEILYKVGTFFGENKSADKAKAYLDEGLRISKEQDLEHYIARFDYALGDLLYQQNDFNQAKFLLLEYISIARKTNDRVLLSRGLYKIGRIFQEEKKPEEAHQYLAEAIEQARSLDHDIDVSIYQCALVEILRIQGQLQYAEKILWECYAIRERHNHEYEAQQILLLLGEVYLEAGDRSQAIQVLNEALLLGEKLGSQVHIKQALNALVKIYAEQKKWGEAIRVVDRVITLHKRLEEKEENKLVLAIRLKTIGQLYVSNKQYDKAEHAFKESLEIWLQLGNQEEVADVEHLLVEPLRKQRKSTEAIEYCNDSVRIYRGIGNASGLSQALRILSSIYKARKQYALAEEILSEAIDQCRETGDTYSEMMVWRAISDIYKRKKEKDENKKDRVFKELIRTSEESLETFRKDGNILRIVGILKSLAALYRAQGRLADAKGLLNECLETRRKQGYRLEVARVLLQLAQITLQEGDIQQGLQLLQESFVITEQMKAEEDIVSIAVLLVRTLIAQGLLQEARRYYERALSLSPNAERLIRLEKEL